MPLLILLLSCLCSNRNSIAFGKEQPPLNPLLIGSVFERLVAKNKVGSVAWRPPSQQWARAGDMTPVQRAYSPVQQRRNPTLACGPAVIKGPVPAAALPYHLPGWGRPDRKRTRLNSSN